jgi:hypothetical protein
MNIKNKNNISLNIDYNLSRIILVYAFFYAFFHILPAFLNYEIQHRLMIADLFDLFTPFVILYFIIKIYRSLLLYIHDDSFNLVKNRVKVILILGAIIFVQGHGMHLSANAIARHLVGQENSSIFILDYFFDEILSHILWDSGIIILSIGIIFMGFSISQKEKWNANLIFVIPAAIFYGFTYFVNAIEGQTVIFTLPISIIIPLAMWIFSRRKARPVMKNPVLAVFFLSYLIALGLFIFWYSWQRGFPQFSELGWI